MSLARDEAAKRQAEANAERSQYDNNELDVVTRYELAKRQRDAAAHSLRAAEQDMARELDSLFNMGNSMERVMILIGEPDKEAIKRMRKLAKSAEGELEANHQLTRHPNRTGPDSRLEAVRRTPAKPHPPATVVREDQPIAH